MKSEKREKDVCSDRLTDAEEARIGETGKGREKQEDEGG